MSGVSSAANNAVASNSNGLDLVSLLGTLMGGAQNNTQNTQSSSLGSILSLVSAFLK